MTTIRQDDVIQSVADALQYISYYHSPDFIQAMAAAFLAQVKGSSPLEVENAAESALEHHLGMTCDPVAGYVQVPCIERCAFGAVKAWIAALIATNEIASRHRVDLDTTIKTLADTGKDMSTKYKETSEAGLAQNLTLC